MLDLPEGLTSEWENALKDLGLVQAKTIYVWPAGLEAFAWDGEGYGEWLFSEKPCLAISTDHSVASLVVSVVTINCLSLECTSIIPGQPIFVEIPQLPVGLHTIHLEARSSQEKQAELLAELNIAMRIRPSRPWLPSTGHQGASCSGN